MQHLSEIERAVLNKLFEGEHKVLRALRAQVDACDVQKRDWTGVGFFTELSVSAGVPPAELRSASIRFGDVVADLSGLQHGAGFLVFIENGCLAALEGYTFDEEWPSNQPSYVLRFESEPRELSALIG